ncbi:MAG: ATP-binding cassette domain-containing protein [Spirochaetales bacterium]|nr:ATP-binding cassette domain-containing protein [Spirochaetales bacterium]
MSSRAGAGVSGLLAARDLSKSYPTASGELRVFRDFSLEVGAGELVGVLGPSGCGKSTLLRLLSSLEPFDSGQLLFEGQPAPEPGRARILLLPDENQLFPWLTAAGNVSFALRASGLPCSRTEAVRLLERVHLREAEDRYPHTLSSGMRQRVVLARGLAARPRMLLMDEPFARLDAQTRGLLQDLVLELWRGSGIAIIFVTHDILELLRVAERIVVLARDGSIRTDEPNTLGEPRDITNPAFAQAYTRLHSLLEMPRGSPSGARGKHAVDREAGGKAPLVCHDPHGKHGLWVAGQDLAAPD